MATANCYERMRPAEIVKARKACPVAYLPIGTIEWHGLQNPVGLDAIKAHLLCQRCATATGGMVFPPLWYGESRSEGLMEATAADAEDICKLMELPPENFAPERARFSVREQYDNYQRLLLHMLTEIQNLGFKLVVILAGHYPLIDHARAACHLFHQARFNNKRAQMLSWVFTGYELVKDEFPEAGDHAGFWETSLLMALQPELVDLSTLPNDPKVNIVGVLSERPVQESSAEYGERAIARIVEKVGAQVKHRLENPGDYYMHGWKA